MQSMGSGWSSILNYATMEYKTLFNQQYSADIGAILVTGISFVASHFGILFIRYVNRRKLIWAGTFGMTASHIMFIVICFKADDHRRTMETN